MPLSIPTSLNIDPKIYHNIKDAQQYADQFISNIEKGQEKEWLQLGIVSWMNQNTEEENYQHVCQADILQLNIKYYVIISYIIPENYDIDKKTIELNVKLSRGINNEQLEKIIDPVWVARGIKHNNTIKQLKIFYIMYSVYSNQNLQHITQELKSILCS
jgi:hypothetical protein